MRMTITCLVSIFLLSSTLHGQTKYEYRSPASERAIPPLVLKAQNEKYPEVLLKSWYVTHISYWQNDVSSGWYSDWYGQRNVIVYSYDQPNYFEVEFIDDPGELSRAFYNKYGYWYETRTRLKGLPIPIRESLKETKYVDWKLNGMVEKIEMNGWPDTVYRFNMTKGFKSSIIRVNANGEFVQSRDLSQ